MGLLSEISGYAEGLANLFYPVLCAGCDSMLRTGERVICTDCKLKLPETNYHDHSLNDTGRRLAGRIPFTHATSLAYFSHEGILQKLLHELKYRSRREVGFYLGELLGHRLHVSKWGGEIDALIPVPLHYKKQLSRGFNQSLEIALGIGKVLDKPVLSKSLVRVRKTESQTRKSRMERLTNMEEAFVLKNVAPVIGKHILLVDDVLTTGATIEACALVLLSAPDTKVSIATIGIAV